jgi:hypothetical protein
MTAAPLVSGTSVIVGSDGGIGRHRQIGDLSGTRLRCASVLKPLLFLAAAQLPPYRDDPEGWRELARPSVVNSENAPTVRLWQDVGQRALLGWLGRHTGGEWPLEPGGERAFGRVLIRSDDVAHAYGQLAARAAAFDRAAAQLLGWMTAVDDDQSFRCRAAVADALNVEPSTIGVKAGWFADQDETVLRTHAVTIAPTKADGFMITAVLSAVAAAPDVLAEYRSRYRDGLEVLALHEQLAGEYLSQATAELVS